GEVLQVAERLERLDPLRPALRELDGSECKTVALLDREPALGARRAGEQVTPRTPPVVVVVQERERLVVVMGEQLGQLGGALAARLPDPDRGLRVRTSALRPRQARVGDVANESVLERILALAGDRRGHALERELATTQRLQHAFEIVDLHEAGERAVPEHAPDN